MYYSVRLNWNVDTTLVLSSVHSVWDPAGRLSSNHQLHAPPPCPILTTDIPLRGGMEGTGERERELLILESLNFNLDQSLLISFTYM